MESSSGGAFPQADFVNTRIALAGTNRVRGEPEAAVPLEITKILPWDDGILSNLAYIRKLSLKYCSTLSLSSMTCTLRSSQRICTIDMWTPP